MTRASFDARLEGLVQGIIRGQELQAVEYAAVTEALERWVARTYPDLVSDAEDVVADAISGLLRALSSGVQIDRPSAYVVTSVRNHALTRLRRGARAQALPKSEPEQLADESEFDASLVERMVSSEQVLNALAAAHAWRSPDGGPDSVAVRVLASFLDLAGDGTPSTRQVARAAGVRHVTVLRVYDQVRTYLKSPGTGWVPRGVLRRQ
jgi:predicted RNA polymerase sigma factor